MEYHSDVLDSILSMCNLECKKGSKARWYSHYFGVKLLLIRRWCCSKKKKASLDKSQEKKNTETR